MKLIPTLIMCLLAFPVCLILYELLLILILAVPLAFDELIRWIRRKLKK